MSIKKVDEIFENLQELQVKSSRLGWTQYTTGYDFGIEEAYKEVTEVLEDKKNYETIQIGRASCRERV